MNDVLVGIKDSRDCRQVHNRVLVVPQQGIGGSLDFLLLDLKRFVINVAALE